MNCIGYTTIGYFIGNQQVLVSTASKCKNIVVKPLGTIWNVKHKYFDKRKYGFKEFNLGR